MTLQDVLDKYINAYSIQDRPPDDSELSLTVSFVIPVFNSAQSIEHTVVAITKLLRADLIKEIVLIDDGSSDDSLAVMEKIVTRHSSFKITVISNGARKYAAYSRNRGIEQCSGDLVFFVDSDIILPSDYLVQHVRRQQIEGPCITFSLRKNISSIKEIIYPAKNADGDFRAPILRENTLHNKSFDFCDTHNLAEMCLTCAVTYRRSDLETVRGCPENFVGWGYNDTAMATKVIALHRPVVPVLSATVYHLEHAPRSGNPSQKWAEFYKNKERYQKMLELPVADTFKHTIEALEL